MSRPNGHNNTFDLDKDRFLSRFLPGKSDGIRRLRAQIAMLNAATNRDIIRNVLICGASGSGKNYVAKVMAGHRQWLIAQNTDRSDDTVEKPLETYTQAFAEVSLPGVPDTLVESELFGHEKGAFTGASGRHDGYLREGYSDILLDEIGDASAALQAKLLRVLSSGQYRPLGGTKALEAVTDARLLLATNRDLLGMVEQGQFREDLLWRAREFVLLVPSLAEQADALPTIAENILADLYGRKPPGLNEHPRLTESDVNFARLQLWPGNIRQLRHALARWLAFGGRRSLAAVVRESEGELDGLRRADASAGHIEEVVTAALDEARASGQAAARTVGEFAGAFGGRAKKALRDWLMDRRPTPHELQVMFPAHKDANAIRTQIRKWGAR